VAYIGTPCTVWGDKELDANCCLYVGVQLLIPPDPVSCVPKYYSVGRLRLLSSHSLIGSHCFQSGDARYSGSSSTPMPRA